MSSLQQDTNQTIASLRGPAVEDTANTKAIILKPKTNQRPSSLPLPIVCNFKCPTIAEQTSYTTSMILYNLLIFIFISCIFFYIYKIFQPKKFRVKSYNNGFFALPTQIPIHKNGKSDIV